MKRGGQQKDMCTHKALMLMDVEEVVAVEEKGEKVALLMVAVGEGGVRGRFDLMMKLYMVTAVTPIPANAGIGLEATAVTFEALPCTLLDGGRRVGDATRMVMDMMSTNSAVSPIPRTGYEAITAAPDADGGGEVGACFVVGTIHSCFIFHDKKKYKPSECFHLHRQTSTRY